MFEIGEQIVSVGTGPKADAAKIDEKTASVGLGPTADAAKADFEVGEQTVSVGTGPKVDAAAAAVCNVVQTQLVTSRRVVSTLGSPGGVGSWSISIPKTPSRTPRLTSRGLSQLQHVPVHSAYRHRCLSNHSSRHGLSSTVSSRSPASFPAMLHRRRFT